MSDGARLERILVALDASPASLAALEAAAELAAHIGAELLGLYVEDEALLRSAELPQSTVVGSFSGSVRPIQRRQVERQLHAQAETARKALEEVAVRSHLRWSFSITRGGVTASLSAAASEADMISIGRGRARLRHRMGRTAASILASGGAPVLLLDHQFRPGQALVTVYDEKPESSRALELAHVLAPSPRTQVVVILRGSQQRLDALESAAGNELRRLGADRRIEFFRPDRGDGKYLARLARRDGIGLLILPRHDALDRSVADLLTELRCPILVVRGPFEHVT